jgi:hypothetical protein
LVFVLISFAATVVSGGLDMAMHDREPALAFLGFWIGQAVFIVVPGAVVGGVIALASNRPILGGKAMIFVNILVTALIILGAFLKVRN